MKRVAVNSEKVPADTQSRFPPHPAFPRMLRGGQYYADLSAFAHGRSTNNAYRFVVDFVLLLESALQVYVRERMIRRVFQDPFIYPVVLSTSNSFVELCCIYQMCIHIHPHSCFQCPYHVLLSSLPFPCTYNMIAPASSAQTVRSGRRRLLVRETAATAASADALYLRHLAPTTTFCTVPSPLPHQRRTHG